MLEEEEGVVEEGWLDVKNIRESSLGEFRVRKGGAKMFVKARPIVIGILDSQSV